MKTAAAAALAAALIACPATAHADYGESSCGCGDACGEDHRGDGELHDAESLSVGVKRTVISLLLVRREVGKFLNPMKSAVAQRKRVEVETTQRHRDVVPVDLPRQI
jgi:hypothetical protein